jgi:hypothetical protein
VGLQNEKTLQNEDEDAELEGGDSSSESAARLSVGGTWRPNHSFVTIGGRIGL